MMMKTLFLPLCYLLLFLLVHSGKQEVVETPIKSWNCSIVDNIVNVLKVV